MNPADFLITGGQGGMTISPTSGADSRIGSTSLNFGNSAGTSNSQLLIAGGFVLGAIFLWGQVK